MVNFENKLIIKVIIITFIMLFVTKQGIFFKFFNKMFLYFNNRYNVLKIKELHRKNVLLKIFFFISLEYLYVYVFFPLEIIINIAIIPFYFRDME